jgi:hypothetical protein
MVIHHPVSILRTYFLAYALQATNGNNARHAAETNKGANSLPGFYKLGKYVRRGSTHQIQEPPTSTDLTITNATVQGISRKADNYSTGQKKSPRFVTVITKARQ